MPHAFFGLTMAGCIALCAFGVLPSGQFVDIAKWSTILYAASTTVVTIVRHVWPRPPAPQFENLAVTDAPPSTWAEPNGVGLPWGFGSLRDDVFSGAMGDGLPPNYTSMVRDHDAPPVTTDGADGSPVLVPSETAQPDVEPEVPSEYLGLLGVPPENRKAPADMAEREARSREAVPPLDFDGVFGPKPPMPHDYNRRPPSRPNLSAPTRAPIAQVNVLANEAADLVILGDPPKKEDPK